MALLRKDQAWGTRFNQKKGFFNATPPGQLLLLLPSPLQRSIPPLAAARPQQWDQPRCCSERCRLIDLGAWADEQHAIPGDAQADDVLSSEVDRD